MWANKRLDASLSDWWFGLRGCFVPLRTDVVADVERRWSPSGEAMVGLSVRSLFDLWLSAQNWEQGDRIIFSALTIADMAFIARSHGLEVAALDIDPITGEPTLDQLAELINDRTRAVVYTHLFGSRGQAEAVQKMAKEHDLWFVEDCAQAYDGSSWRGLPEADLTLFSFGPIKTSTAFGGGLARVAEPLVLGDMMRLAAQSPQQPRSEYVMRLMKFGALGVATKPWVFAVLVRLLDRFGPGYDQSLQRLTRGFPGPGLLPRIRRRPHPSMVALLGRRLDQADSQIRQSSELAEYLVDALDGVPVPTSASARHTYWLIPVLATDPQALIKRLSSAGFHATRGRALAVVEHDPGVQGPEPKGARILFDQAVFLPFAPGMPPQVLDDLALRVRSALSERVVTQEQ